LRCDNITKYYVADNKKEFVLNDVSLKLNDNEILFIQGVSGSGKTTLLNLIGLLDAPNIGEIYYKNTKFSAITNSEKTRIRRNEIGIIFQKYNLFPQFNVLDNVIFPLYYQRTKVRKKILEEEAKEILTRLDIIKFHNKNINQLSGGQQQRVAIARVLLQKPQILLADEPTANVDKATEKIIMDIFNDYKKSGSVVIVSHNPSYREISDKKIILVDGRIRYD
jgi:ABC-type antimicrobial peptide transport system, ATPase component